MKEILFILFLIPTLIYGQDVRIIDLDPADAPDANDILYFEQDEVAKNITKSLLQKTLSDSLNAAYDSVAVHLDTLQTHNTRINSTTKILDTINPSGVALIVNANTVVKPGDGSVDISVLLSRLRALEKDYYGVSSPDEALLLHYKFERNTNDESSFNMAGIASSGFTYSDLDSDGSRYTGEFTGTEFVTSPPVDHSSTFSTLVDVVIGNDSSGVRTLIGNMSGSDGWKLQLDHDTKKIQFVTGDGVDTDTVFSNADAYAVDTIYPHVIFRAGVTSTGVLYKNGSEITGTGSIQTGFETDDSVRIGSARGGSGYSYSYLDNPKIFSGVLDSADFWDEYLLNEYYQPNLDPTVIFSSGEVKAGAPGQVYLYFNENLYNFDEDSVVDAFTYAINDSIATIDSVDLDKSTLIFYADSCVYGNSLKISYDATYYSGLEDFGENKLATFYSRSVTNNLDEPGTDTIPLADIQYLFENNGLDNINNYTLIDTSTTFTTAWAAEGTYSKSSTGTSGKLYIPATYNSDALTDTFTIAFWAYVTTPDPWVLLENDGYSTGEGIQVRVNTAGDDFVIIGETSNSGNETRSTNFTGSAPVNNEAHHFAITYESGSGVCRIYINGVLDQDSDTLVDASIDLSGNWRLISSGGRIDDFQVYPIRLTSNQIATIYNNPGMVAYGPGSGGATPPAPDPEPGQTEFDTYAIAVFRMIDFEGYSLGDFPESSMEPLIPEAEDYSKGSGYKAGYSAYWPDIVSYDYDSAGTTLNSKGIKLYEPEGETWTYMNYFKWKFPHDPSNIDVYLSWSVQHVPSSAWETNGVSTEWKNNVMVLGYDDRLNEVDISSTSYESASAKILGYPNTNATTMRWRSQAKGGWTVLYAPGNQLLMDPDDLASTYYFNDNTENLYNLTIRICSDDIDNPGFGFYEWFIDGKFSRRVDAYNDVPIKVVNTGVVTDGFELKYHWNEPGPTGADASIIVDDPVMFRYKQSFSGASWRTKSSNTRKLRLPNWNTDGGYKITINE